MGSCELFAAAYFLARAFAFGAAAFFFAAATFALVLAGALPSALFVPASIFFCSSFPCLLAFFSAALAWETGREDRADGGAISKDKLN